MAEQAGWQRMCCCRQAPQSLSLSLSPPASTRRASTTLRSSSAMLGVAWPSGPARQGAAHAAAAAVRASRGPRCMFAPNSVWEHSGNSHRRKSRGMLSPCHDHARTATKHSTPTHGTQPLHTGLACGRCSRGRQLASLHRPQLHPVLDLIQQRCSWVLWCRAPCCPAARCCAAAADAALRPLDVSPRLHLA